MSKPAQPPLPASLDALAHAPQERWLHEGRALALRDTQAALALFSAAVARFPQAGELQLGLAGLRWQSGDANGAETLLRDWLAQHRADEGASFLLVELLREQGRLQAVAAVMRACFAHGTHALESVIRAIEVLDDYGRPQDALALAEDALAGDASDPRLHAYAGMLQIQLGRFAQAREHYAFALAHEARAVDWNIPLGLAGLQRYSDPGHADLAFFRDLLQQPTLHERTRRDTWFALGKAYDDLGDSAEAVACWREANAIAHAHSHWSRKLWRRNVEARLNARPDAPLAPADGWTPLFVVGVPRSGTTLLAEQLSRYPGVRHRGELGWLETWEQRLASTTGDRQALLRQAAAHCERQWRQDDAPASHYLDKQPLNLLRVDLILSLWPNARIIHCDRQPRDTALSLWAQSFHDAAHDYAYDMDDIASVIQGCQRLAAHWQKRYPQAFRRVSYEALVDAPEATLAELAAWLGLPPQPGATAVGSSGIATASAWQARQPVYTRSSGRWRRYQAALPELGRVPER